MIDRKGMFGLAACAALAAAGVARADEKADTKLVPDLSLQSPLHLDDQPAPPPPPSKPLMALLEAVGVGKPLEAANINLYGFIEGAYTYSFSSPPGDIITGNVFNTRHNRPTVTQADFTAERTVDAAAAAKNGTFDIGFRGEILYGTDGGAIHSDGLFDNSATRGETGNGYYKGRFTPEYQFDLNQAYVDVAIPVGNGLRIRAGKFVTLLGEEVINPTGNYLYSHSYLFGDAIPFTHTGVLGTYALNDKFTIDAGVTRGWDQSLKDNNGAIDFLGRVTFTPDKTTNIYLTLSEGPQSNQDNHNYWTVFDLVATKTIGDKLTVAFNGDYGDAPHALAPGSAQWYGVAAYASYVLSPMFTLNARAEWYDDANGFTLGGPTSLSIFEATAGVAITPFPDNNIAKNFVIRPEIRGDYATKAFFDNATDHYQVQAAVDAYFTY